ncbi:hypothetical protein ACFRCQ_25900 [Cytobacillus firmus]|uniref:hypothetical protein n=1 Tax=Cytobacillus firmus TaxID=1399 RepID=UPI0036CC7FE1
MYQDRLEEIKVIHNKANEAYMRAQDTGSCADEDIVRDSLSELFREEHTDWLIKQAELLKKISDTWVAIETNGTSEEADDFYTIVQDILTTEQD